MISDGPMTLSELGRRMDDLKEMFHSFKDEVSERQSMLANKMDITLGPVSELKVKVEVAEKDIDALGSKVEGIIGRVTAIEVRAAAYAGGVSVLIWLADRLLK